MSGFVSEENILLNQQATTKEEALRTISDAAARIGVADDADAVYAAFLAREEIDKTGMVDGFAVPHCKTDAVKSAAVIIFKNAQPVEWPSLDDKPVDIAMRCSSPTPRPAPRTCACSRRPPCCSWTTTSSPSCARATTPPTSPPRSTWSSWRKRARA